MLMLMCACVHVCMRACVCVYVYVFVFVCFCVCVFVCLGISVMWAARTENTRGAIRHGDPTYLLGNRCITVVYARRVARPPSQAWTAAGAADVLQGLRVKEIIFVSQ
jgi:hypothetical protein